MIRKLLIDTDPGVDDTLAIFYALGSKNANIAALTTCFGNAAVQKVTRNAQFVLATAGSSRVPVYKGAAQPWAQESIPAIVHGEEGLGDIVPPDRWTTRELTASAEIGIQGFLDSPGSESKTIVAVAPLTNIANALRMSAHSFKNCDRLVILGGTFTAPGNKGPVAEFNFRNDPEAADFVLTNCPCEIVVIPLDICMRSAIALNSLSRIRDLAFKTFLINMCETYATANKREEGVEGIIMYDPLAVCCALSPELFKFERYWMRVDTGMSYARGAAIVDRREQSELTKNVSIAIDCDLTKFTESFFDALNTIHFEASPQIK